MKKQQGKRLISEAVAAFESCRPLYEEYGLKLEELFRELLAQDGTHYQAIEHRTKSLDSLREKIARPAKVYREGLKDITDLCGLRIITYTLTDVRGVSDLIEREFAVLPQHTVDKGALLNPAEFGYRSRHFVLHLSDSRSGLVEWKRFANLPAEVQVRTVLEHAWAAIDHSLRYKREADVPKEQKRALFRLSALLELADESFEGLMQQQKALRKEAKLKLLRHADMNLELNALNYAIYAQSAPILRELMSAALTAGFAEPLLAFEFERATDIQSDLIAVARAQGIVTIGNLDRVLQEEKRVAASYFEDLLKKMSGPWHASPTFVALLCLLRRDASMEKERLLAFGWHEEIADRVVRAASAHRAKPSKDK